VPEEMSAIRTLVDVESDWDWGPKRIFPAGSYGVIVAVHTDPELYTVEIIIKDDSLVGGADHDVVDLTPDQFVEIPGFPDQPFPPSQ